MGALGLGKSRLKIDEIEEEIQILRNNALKTIDECSVNHGQGLVVNNQEVELLLQQIKNRMIIVAVVGEGSTGKSTLINALLRDRFLPSAIGRVTGVRIFIGHSPEVHPGPCKSPDGCDNCPFLVEGFQAEKKAILCRGVTNIASEIEKENERSSHEQPLVLYTYIPVFAASFGSTGNCRPYLVDSPGVESVFDDMKKSKSYYSVLSTMVYVENYQRLLMKEESIKTQLALKPENASLLFTVSHFDNYFTNLGEKNPDEEATRERVTNQIQEIKYNDVYPLCGKWALHVHLMKAYNNDNDVALTVDRAYADYSRRRNLDGNDKAKSLERVTGLIEIEESLKRSVDEASFDQWNLKMYRQCQKLLEDPIQKGKEVLERIKQKETDLENNVKKLKGRKELSEFLVKDIKKYCSEFEQKVENALADIEEKINPKIEATLNDFCESCKEKAKRTYNFGQFLKDMRNFERNKFSKVVDEEVNSIVKSCFEVLMSELAEKYKRLIGQILEQDISHVDSLAIGSNIFDDRFLRGAFKHIQNIFNDKKLDNKTYWLLGGICLSGCLLAIGAVSVPVTIISTLTLSVSAGAVGGSTYFMYQKWNIGTSEMILSEGHIDQICQHMEADFESNYTGIKQKSCESTLAALQQQSKCLKDNYDENWNRKLGEELELVQESLDELHDEESQLEQALEKLDAYSYRLQVLCEQVQLADVTRDCD